MSKYKVWECKIVIDGNIDLPKGFDNPPRRAAEQAVEDAGIEVLGCFSGWGDELEEKEIAVLEERLPHSE